MNKMSNPSRHWCATFWNEPKSDDERIRYAIYGYEICPETGREHWQSYMEFNKPQRRAAIKKMYNDKTVHIEMRKGTREEARDYCKKEGNYIEVGRWIKGQGHRTDLENFASRLFEGEQLNDLIEEQPELYSKYRNGLRDIAEIAAEKNTPDWRNIEVVLHTGKTGCGKTRTCVEENKGAFLKKASKLRWWNNYKGQDTLILDEYANNIKCNELIEYFDGYKQELDVKGSQTYARWTKVFVTTNLKLHEIHANALPEHRHALFRRVTKIIDHWSGKTYERSETGWPESLYTKDESVTGINPVWL